MSEEIKNVINPEENSDVKEMVLSTPIRARGEDVKVLKYNFASVTNAQYINALCSDRNAIDPFHLSGKQAFNLFCEAAANATEGVDATDLRERMAVKDTMFAIQVATVFFAVSTREASMRTVKD